jgi:hypothetical protein
MKDQVWRRRGNEVEDEGNRSHGSRDFSWSSSYSTRDSNGISSRLLPSRMDTLIWSGKRGYTRFSLLPVNLCIKPGKSFCPRNERIKSTQKLEVTDAITSPFFSYKSGKKSRCSTSTGILQCQSLLPYLRCVHQHFLSLSERRNFSLSWHGNPSSMKTFSDPEATEYHCSQYDCTCIPFCVNLIVMMIICGTSSPESRNKMLVSLDRKGCQSDWHEREREREWKTSMSDVEDVKLYCSSTFLTLVTPVVAVTLVCSVHFFCKWEGNTQHILSGLPWDISYVSICFILSVVFDSWMQREEKQEVTERRGKNGSKTIAFLLRDSPSLLHSWYFVAELSGDSIPSFLIIFQAILLSYSSLLFRERERERVALGLLLRWTLVLLPWFFLPCFSCICKIFS